MQSTTSECEQDEPDSEFLSWWNAKSKEILDRDNLSWCIRSFEDFSKYNELAKKDYSELDGNGALDVLDKAEEERREICKEVGYGVALDFYGKLVGEYVPAVVRFGSDLNCYMNRVEAALPVFCEKMKNLGRGDDPEDPNVVREMGLLLLLPEIYPSPRISPQLH